MPKDWQMLQLKASNCCLAQHSIRLISGPDNAFRRCTNILYIRLIFKDRSPSDKSDSIILPPAKRPMRVQSSHNTYVYAE